MIIFLPWNLTRKVVCQPLLFKNIFCFSFSKMLLRMQVHPTKQHRHRQRQTASSKKSKRRTKKKSVENSPSFEWRTKRRKMAPPKMTIRVRWRCRSVWRRPIWPSKCFLTTTLKKLETSCSHCKFFTLLPATVKGFVFRVYLAYKVEPNLMLRILRFLVKVR